jgi:flagellar motility protein MotE (MotC chaperone)
MAQEPEKISAEAAVAEMSPADKGPKKKSGLIKYIIFGAAGLVAISVVAVGTVFLLGGRIHKPSEAAISGADSVAVHDSLKKEVPPTKAEQAVKSEHDTTTGGSAASAEHAEALPADSLQRTIDSLTATDTSILAEVNRNLAALDYDPTKDSSAKPTTIVMTAKDSLAAVSWLDKEKEKLRDKEKALNVREVQLNKLDAELSKKMIKIEQVTTAKIADLAKLYDGMDSKAVAAMMASLDDTTIVSVLPRMKQKNASIVLGLMPPARAASISRQMIMVADN